VLEPSALKKGRRHGQSQDPILEKANSFENVIERTMSVRGKYLYSTPR
jgi:hypothetical protein